MIGSDACFDRYGEPERETAMTLWDVPTTLEVGTIPKRIYCNRDMISPLTLAFTNLIERGMVGELRTWDGCFNIRRKRGGMTPSLHSWGVAIDVNAAWNAFGKRPVMTPALVECFTDAGFDWGGVWRIPDGMHFQLREFPS